jgi:hypothetical protein
MMACGWEHVCVLYKSATTAYDTKNNVYIDLENELEA